MTSYENQNEIIRAAHINLAATIRHRIQHSHKGRIFEQDGVLMFSIGHSVASGHLNGLLKLNGDAGHAEILDKTQAFFQPLTNDFTVWVRDQIDDGFETALRNSGFVSVREPGIPCMVLHERLASISSPADITLSRVTEEKDAADYAQVMVTAFGLSNDVSQDAFGRKECLFAPNVAAFIARRNNVPVAAATTVQTENVAGVYYVGTIPEARGQGLGELCTRFATNAGFDLGASAVILQASVAGEPLYRRMGYKLLTRYRWYCLPTTEA